MLYLKTHTHTSHTHPKEKPTENSATLLHISPPVTENGMFICIRLVIGGIRPPRSFQVLFQFTHLGPRFRLSVSPDQIFQCSNPKKDERSKNLVK